MEKAFIAIVPSAGLGTRFGSSQRKTFAGINGVPLLIYTLKRLNSEKAVSEIIPVLRQEDISMGQDMMNEHGLNKVKRIAPGGKERQDSIYNALKLLEEEGADSSRGLYVLIHDGVRPYIPEGTIDQLIDAVEGVDGVIPAVPVKDTMKEIDNNSIVISTLNRDNMRAVQTPQLFAYQMIKRAYDKAYEDGHYATDDAALVEREGGKIRVIEGSQFNIKVTMPEDLELVKYVIDKERNEL